MLVIRVLVVLAFFALRLSALDFGYKPLPPAPKSPLAPRAYEAPWEPVAPGTVLTRNFMAPKSPDAEGYRLLPKQFSLGSKAYGRLPPAWWLALVEIPKGDPLQTRLLPLAYAGQISKDGAKTTLLVVQFSHAFTGDGSFAGPGPQLYFIARIFELEGKTARQVSQQNFPLDDLQFSRVFAGEKRSSEVVFRIEGGQSFDSHETAFRRKVVLSIGPSNRLTKKELRDGGE